MCNYIFISYQYIYIYIYIYYVFIVVKLLKNGRRARIRWLSHVSSKNDFLSIVIFIFSIELNCLA